MPNNTSISARGVSADTESTTIMSTAPDLHILSAADEEGGQTGCSRYTKNYNCQPNDQLDVDK
jgi:hypothetical protein